MGWDVYQGNSTLSWDTTMRAPVIRIDTAEFSEAASHGEGENDCQGTNPDQLDQQCDCCVEAG